MIVLSDKEGNHISMISFYSIYEIILFFKSQTAKTLAIQKTDYP